ncbi:MAG TPA: hypothetical protein VFC33_12630 [Acidimicrobiia bacterium]|nr:hypothetical protein [Acidimicrobiia bacterium]
MIGLVIAQTSTSQGLAHRSLWYPTVLGILVVVAAVGLFCGSVYLLLTTNLGARLGFLIAVSGLTGMMCLLSLLWLTTASPLDTLKGRQPTWKAVAQLDSPSASKVAEIRNIKTQGKPVAAADEANIKAAADAVLVIPTAVGGAKPPTPGPFAKFQQSTDYVVSNIRTVGGSHPNPLKLQFTHKPYYAVAQVCPVKNVRVPFGAPLPTPTCDPTKPVSYLVFELDLGSMRVPPLVVFFASVVLFALSLLGLHWRERDLQEMAAEAERAGGAPVPARL